MSTLQIINRPEVASPNPAVICMVTRENIRYRILRRQNPLHHTISPKVTFELIILKVTTNVIPVPAVLQPMLRKLINLGGPKLILNIRRTGWVEMELIIHNPVERAIVLINPTVLTRAVSTENPFVYEIHIQLRRSEGRLLRIIDSAVIHIHIRMCHHKRFASHNKLILACVRDIVQLKSAAGIIILTGEILIDVRPFESILGLRLLAFPLLSRSENDFILLRGPGYTGKRILSDPHRSESNRLSNRHTWMADAAYKERIIQVRLQFQMQFLSVYH